MLKYACKKHNKWHNNIQLHFIVKHFNMTQRRVLCPHNHLLKTATTTGDIRELSSLRVDCLRAVQSVRCPVHELTSLRVGVSANTLFTPFEMDVFQVNKGLKWLK